MPKLLLEHIFLRRIGEQYPDRNFDEVNPKLFVLAGEANPACGDDAYPSDDRTEHTGDKCLPIQFASSASLPPAEPPAGP